MSTFNLEAFSQTPINQAFDTKYVPHPQGEYLMVIKGPFMDEKATKLRTTEKGQVILDVVYETDGTQLTPDGKPLKDELGMDTGTVRQSIFLDIEPAGGLSAARGKNVKLGKLREALGQNDPSKPWSFTNLIGGVVKGTIKHDMVKDEVYANVTAVVKA